MRPITKYEAEDGTIHDTEAQAYAHEQIQSIRKWYEDNTIYGNVMGCRIDFKELHDWLKKHHGQVTALLTASDILDNG